MRDVRIARSIEFQMTGAAGVIHSNYLSGMHGFQDNEVLLQAEYDVIVISPSRSVFSCQILKERP